MRHPARVLVVDDSALLRSIVAETINGHPDFTVIGQASSGSQALSLIERLDPDLVSLDIELGDITGLEVIEKVMSSRPRRIVVVSSHTDAGADVTLTALSLGAVDFVSKGRLEKGPAGFEARLLATFTAAIQARLPTGGHVHRPVEDRAPLPPEPTKAEPPAPARPAPARSGPARPTSSILTRPELLVVASSTGGPPALQILVAELSKPLGFPAVIVQHMPVGFTARLATRLDELGPNRVSEAADGDPLEAGRILVAPGGFHLIVERRRVRLDDGPAVGGLRPRADLTLTSAVSALGSRVLACVLTGMGDDGLTGCRQLVEAGGQVIAQDAASCTVDGMPRQVREAGLVLDMGSPAYLAGVIDRLTPGRAVKATSRLEATR